MFQFYGLVFGAVHVLKATELWGFVSSNRERLLKMVVAPSRHVFDEAICVHLMYSCICFKNVLGIG